MSHETFMEILRLSGTFLITMILGLLTLIVCVALYGSVRSFLNKERIVRDAMRRSHREPDDIP